MKAMRSSASSRHDAPNDTSGADMKKESIVRYSYDPKNPPPLTDEQVARLEALAALPEEQIDFSEIPPLTDAFLKNALRAPFLYPPVHLDADVVEWFQKQVGETGSLMMAVNHVLRDHVRAEKKKAAKKAG